MNITQQLLDLSPRPKLRVSEIERLIRNHRIIVPPPCRKTLISLCDDGTFETAPRTKSTSPFLVYEDSFLNWIKSLDQENPAD